LAYNGYDNSAARLTRNILERFLNQEAVRASE